LFRLKEKELKTERIDNLFAQIFAGVREQRRYFNLAIFQTLTGDARGKKPAAMERQNHLPCSRRAVDALLVFDRGKFFFRFTFNAVMCSAKGK